MTDAVIIAMQVAMNATRKTTDPDRRPMNMIPPASTAAAKLISFVAARPRRSSRASAAFNFVITIHTAPPSAAMASGHTMSMGRIVAGTPDIRPAHTKHSSFTSCRVRTTLMLPGPRHSPDTASDSGSVEE